MSHGRQRECEFEYMYVQLCMCLCSWCAAQGARKEGQPVDMAKAQADAQALYSAGAGRVGTEESTFVRLLAAESPEQLAAVFDVYQRQFNRTFEQTLESELSGDFLDGMLAIGTR